MQKETIAETVLQNTDATEEMIASLVAISIVAKRLAKQISRKEQQSQKEVSLHEKCERCSCIAHCFD